MSYTPESDASVLHKLAPGTPALERKFFDLFRATGRGIREKNICLRDQEMKRRTPIDVGLRMARRAPI